MPRRPFTGAENHRAAQGSRTSSRLGTRNTLELPTISDRERDSSNPFPASLESQTDIRTRLLLALMRCGTLRAFRSFEPSPPSALPVSLPSGLVVSFDLHFLLRPYLAGHCRPPPHDALTLASQTLHPASDRTDDLVALAMLEFDRASGEEVFGGVVAGVDGEVVVAHRLGGGDGRL